MCASKVTQEVNFPKHLWGYYAREDCSCAPILRFFDAASDGATANRQIPDHIFGQFEEDSIANYATDFDKPVLEGNFGARITS